MNFRRALLLFALLGASCSESLTELAPQPEGKTVHVTIGSAPRVEIASETRTALDEDGVTVRWTAGDAIALWADDAAGTSRFAAVPFAMWHYNSTFNSAKFSGDIPAMEAGSYTYYAISPVPVSVEGKKAYYDIPATQDGSFNGACDIMVAEPVTTDALVEGDNSERMNLSFSHKIHVLKIRITGSDLGEPITRLELSFARAVTGRLRIDATDPTADPYLSEGNSTLTINLAEPITGEATLFAAIAPIDFFEEEAISIKAVGTSRESRPGSFAGKNFQAGHTTPIRLHVPKAAPIEVYVDLTEEGSATLGEPIINFTLSAEGAHFDNGAASRLFTSTGAGLYKMSFDDVPTDLLGKSVTVTYESENAIVTDTFTMPSAATFRHGMTVAELTVPYLFTEDFSTVEGFSSNDEYKTSSSGSKDAVWFLNGWSGGRIGAQANTAIRLAARRETSARYPARVDSAPLTAIKAGKKVNLDVQFDYGMGRQEGGIGTANVGMYCYMGYVTSNTAYKSGDDTGTFNAELYVKETNGSYTNLPHKAYPFTLTGCGPETRITWRAQCENKAGLNNSTCWLYIDNIKVSIAN